jgi:hypothetical protein
MNVRHLYRRLRPVPTFQRVVSNFVDKSLWQGVKDIKAPWREEGRFMGMDDIYYLETPYIRANLVDYASLERYVSCIGGRSKITDSHSISHTWFMEETIIDTLVQEKYAPNDKVWITQRSWFYQDYNTQNTEYPEKMLHFINIFPENGRLRTGAIWESIHHNQWYPEWEDYDDEVDAFQGYLNEEGKEVMYDSMRV